MKPSVVPLFNWVHRRTLLRVAALGLAVTPMIWGASEGEAIEPIANMARIRRELFVRSLQPGTAVFLSASYYTERAGGDLISMYGFISHSDTVAVLRGRWRPDKHLEWELSNFATREDRETGEIVVHMCRFFEHSSGDIRDWTSDANVYHIPVD